MDNDQARAWLVKQGREWLQDPVKFVRQVFGVEPSPQQSEVLKALAIPGSKITVKSGHGVGKSAVLSWAMIWFLLLHPTCKIPCTAPTAHQLFDVLWAEAAKWIKRMPRGLQLELNQSSDKLTIKGQEATRFAVARTARPENPEALQGFHDDYLLFLLDEASGIPDAVFTVAEGAMSGPNARIIMVSNPTQTTGYFFESFHKARDMWTRFTFSCLDSALVTKEYIARMAQRYGEDSDIYKIRVLGEFPSSSLSQFIATSIVNDAVGRDLELSSYTFAPIVIGVDVARYGDDRSCIIIRQGLQLLKIFTYTKKDLMTLCGYISEQIEIHKPQCVFIDEIGLGSGVVDRLRQLNYRNIIGVNVAKAALHPDKSHNLRAEIWGNMRDWLIAGGSIPNNADLIDDLTGVEYFFDAKNRLQMEGKDELKARGLASPDLADALALTFAATVSVQQEGSGYRPPDKSMVA